MLQISIHAPLAGCDPHCTKYGDCPEIFQSTHPLRGATAANYLDDETILFQSTHPLRGATHASEYRQIVEDISIHAPLAGCDWPLVSGFSCGGYFNPRTPCGVRHCKAHPDAVHRHFNPRTPCGVRRRKEWMATLDGNFNPRTPCGVRPSDSRSTMGFT